MRIFAKKLLTFSLAAAVAPAWAETVPLPPDDVSVIGEMRSVRARQEDTLSDIARRYGLGYQEAVLANPGIDPWVPGEGTKIVLPMQHILPDAPREGVVINIPEMRLYYYPPAKKGMPRQVVTLAVSIGRMDWKTPLGVTRVIQKTANPAWYPPASVRIEHAERGDILPKVVPPGPDNPLGKFAMRLDIPGYLIHSTNNPYGIGMRVTHGCIRLYPEDIQAFFDSVPVGTPVRLVNQPFKAGRRDGELYFEAHPPLDEDQATYKNFRTHAAKAVIAASSRGDAGIDWKRVEQAASAKQGMPTMVSLELAKPPAEASAEIVKRVSVQLGE